MIALVMADIKQITYRMQSRTKTLQQSQTRLKSPPTGPLKKTVIDEKLGSNSTKSIRKRMSPNHGTKMDSNESSAKTKKMMDNTIPVPVESSYQCGTCEKNFNTQIDLATHLLSHNAEKLESSRSSSSFSVSRSSISEDNDDDVNDDANKDDSLQVYCCPACGKKEYDETELFKHFSANHKNPENRNYGCPGFVRNHTTEKLLPCQKRFQNVTILYKHVNDCHNEKSSQTTSTPPTRTTTTTRTTTATATAAISKSSSSKLSSKKKRRGRKKKSVSSLKISSSSAAAAASTTTTTPTTRSATRDDDRNDTKTHNTNNYTSDSDTSSTNEKSVKSKTESNASNHSSIRLRNRRNNVIESPVISQREQRANKKSVQPVTRVSTNTNKSTKEFPCGDDCLECYTDLKALHKHRLKKHPEKTFHVCVQCGYIPYSSLSGLQKHQNEHSNHQQ